MEFQTLDQVLAHQFVGNAWADCDALSAIDRFILRADVPLDEARRAIDHITQNGMGLGAAATEADVLEMRRAGA